VVAGVGDEVVPEYLITSKNGRPVAASPHANSASWAAVSTVMLPKLAYTTDPVACSSSQARHSVSFFHRLRSIESESPPR
jgi:hypothetical protein